MRLAATRAAFPCSSCTGRREAARHGTVGLARLWKQELVPLLDQAARR